jgi:aminopeptidase N
MMAGETETPSAQETCSYHDASLYDVTLTAPDGLIVVATGTSISEVDNGDGTTTRRLVGGPMRDFNIVASGGYQSASKQVGDVSVNSYFSAEDAAGGTQALDWAATALQTFERKFGPYPYRELDIAATSTSAGGIEYPGMVVIAGRLFDDMSSRAFFEAATVHEVAHQWWYDVVGNDQVNQPWLDEGLAQYSTYLYYRDVYERREANRVEDSLQRRWERVSFVEAGGPSGQRLRRQKNTERSSTARCALPRAAGSDRRRRWLIYCDATTRFRLGRRELSQEFQALAETVSGQDLTRFSRNGSTQSDGVV